MCFFSDNGVEYGHITCCRLLLEDLLLAYRNKGHAPIPVLEDISLRVPAGGSAALMGCSKSTILSLISRLNDPVRGSILLDGGRTVIMVAHRLSTVVNCGRLFYIEDGKVLASGTYDELLKTCEPYRKMYAEEAAVS